MRRLCESSLARGNGALALDGGHLAFRRGMAGRLTQLRQRAGAGTTQTLGARRARARRLGALQNCRRIPRELDGNAWPPAATLPGG